MNIDKWAEGAVFHMFETHIKNRSATVLAVSQLMNALDMFRNPAKQEPGLEFEFDQRVLVDKTMVKLCRKKLLVSKKKGKIRLYSLKDQQENLVLKE